jgi:uncharacterized protein
MLKWLLVIGIIWFVYNFYIKKKTLSAKKQNQDLEDNDMVQCSTCKIYVEINEAILSNGKYYCSKECLRNSK